MDLCSSSATPAVLPVLPECSIVKFSTLLLSLPGIRASGGTAVHYINSNHANKDLAMNVARDYYVLSIGYNETPYLSP